MERKVFGIFAVVIVGMLILASMPVTSATVDASGARINPATEVSREKIGETLYGDEIWLVTYSDGHTITELKEPSAWTNFLRLMTIVSGYKEPITSTVLLSDEQTATFDRYTVTLYSDRDGYPYPTSFTLGSYYHPSLIVCNHDVWCLYSGHITATKDGLPMKVSRSVSDPYRAYIDAEWDYNLGTEGASQVFTADNGKFVVKVVGVPSGYYSFWQTYNSGGICDVYAASAIKFEVQYCEELQVDINAKFTPDTILVGRTEPIVLSLDIQNLENVPGEYIIRGFDMYYPVAGHEFPTGTPGYHGVGINIVTLSPLETKTVSFNVGTWPWSYFGEGIYTYVIPDTEVYAQFTVQSAPPPPPTSQPVWQTIIDWLWSWIWSIFNKFTIVGPATIDTATPVSYSIELTALAPADSDWSDGTYSELYGGWVVVAEDGTIITQSDWAKLTNAIYSTNASFTTPVTEGEYSVVAVIAEIKQQWNGTTNLWETLPQEVVVKESWKFTVAEPITQPPAVQPNPIAELVQWLLDWLKGLFDWI